MVTTPMSIVAVSIGVGKGQDADRVQYGIRLVAVFRKEVWTVAIIAGARLAVFATLTVGARRPARVTVEMTSTVTPTSVADLAINVSVQEMLIVAVGGHVAPVINASPVVAACRKAQSHAVTADIAKRERVADLAIIVLVWK